uniref:Uncharacterized protein n=1 Tax=Ditylenchus dipsaci TaxID=166011 RepID=A0A915CLV7_9BILA
MSVKYMFVGNKSENTFQVQAGHQGALLYSNNDDCILNFGDSKFFVTGLIVSLPPSILGRVVPIHSEGAVKYLPQPSVFTGEEEDKLWNRELHNADLNEGLNRVMCNLDRVINENEFAQFFPDIIRMNGLVMHPAVLLPGSDMKDRNRCVTVTNPGLRNHRAQKGMSVGCILVSKICPVITAMVAERKNL